MRTLAENAGKTAPQGKSGAEYGANSALIDADLRSIIKAWPDLDAATRADILVAVRSAGE